MLTNLMIVEGLPGSGKSTTAAMIADELNKKGKKVICVDEGSPEHPADYSDYDFPDFETEQRKILEKWRAFTEKSDKDTIYVFNCIFLQNPMCETMMRFGMDDTASQNYISEISEIIKPLNPVIIYIDQPDVEGSIRRVIAERGKDWLNAVIDYHTSQGYGKQNGHCGYEGYIKCLEERKIRELKILRALDIDYYTVSQDMGTEEFAELFASAGRIPPLEEQMDLAVRNSTKSFIVRHKERAVAAINWLGDYGMHWFMKEFIVSREFQGQMIGTFLYRFSENFIKSTLKENWKVCVDLITPEGKEGFYGSLGFRTISENETGSAMEKMIEG